MMLQGVISSSRPPCDYGRTLYHVEKVSSARHIVLSAEGISGTGKSSSVLSGDLRFTWRLCP